MTDQTVSLVVRRTISATAERVFEAWTTPEHLERWWGPPGVRCPKAEIDLRVGGRYRIANELPDGKVLWIAGEFEVITPPSELVYTWSAQPEVRAPERVTVKFQAVGDDTEVIVVHERIANEAMRHDHEQGWNGCLDGLVELFDVG